MTDEERFSWIDRRVEEILSYPVMWGSNETVEQLFLQSLEFKYFLQNPSNPDPRAVMSDYQEFLESTFRDGRTIYATPRVANCVELVQVLRDYLTVNKLSL